VSFSPGLRRVPPPDLDSVAGDPVLVERIAAEIERDGPLTFARFMELALYEPDHGYYRAASARPGRGGDFLTAPEASPIFGRAVARHVVDAWNAIGKPPSFTVREYGAGSGSLAVAILDGLAAEEPALYRTVRYRAVEIEARRLAELRERVVAGGHGDRLEPDDDGPIVGAVIANEVLDALPTHRVQGAAAPGGHGNAPGPSSARDPDATSGAAVLLESFVDWRDGAFVEVVGPPSTPALAERLATEGVTLRAGQRAEICLVADGWVTDAAAGLERGVALLIDYGYPATELYDPVRRPDGTLAAYLGQRAHGDPYRAVGRQDLTAHVDTTAVERAAAAVGLSHLATTTQGQFLAGLGAGELLVGLQTGPDATLQRYLDARAALVRMIDPAAMGRFRVLAFGRGLDQAAQFRGLGRGD
jgi:SAM-dependent MidA family methyltransferase